jgi:type IV pilus assembly protein PilO
MAMNFSLNKLPWYGQLGMFAVLSLAGAGVFWNFYAKPAQASIDTRQVELKGIRADINRGLATARRLPEFRRQVEDLKAQLERLRPVLPEEKDVSDLLRRIQGMATQSSLQIRGFKPQPVATRTMYAEWPIGLELDGTYHNLGSFLERVSKFPRIINITGMHIKTKDNGGPTQTIEAECTATTFVLIEKPAADTATAGGRGAAPGGRGAAPGGRTGGASAAKPKA